MTRRFIPTEQRFWDKVDVRGPDECWLWKGGLSDGYGAFGVKRRMTHAHRVAFEIFFGKKPEKHVLHRCDNKVCVNPRHLYEGDDVDNMRDLYMGGGGKRELSNEDVREIKRLGKMGLYTQEEIATGFRCCAQNVGRILNGQIYVHI